MENMNYSLSDLAAVTNGADGWGNNNIITLLLLFALLGGNGIFGNRNNVNDYATAASQQEILSGQKFDALGRQINQVGDGISSLGYSQLQQMDSNTASINANVVSEGRGIQTQLSNCCCENQRNTDALRYDMATMFANSNANTTAQTQKILDALAQDKIASLQAQVSELKTQNMFCGIPRISNYAYGVYPYATTGCNCGNI